jgi:hypothetical protein
VIADLPPAVEVAVARKELRVLAVALAVSLIALIAAIGAIVNLTDTYDPFGEFPPQRVESRVYGRDEPSVLLSEGYVVVAGRKCMEERSAIRGEFSWVERVPGGFVSKADGNIGNGRAANVRPKGCTTREFHNDMPRSVRDRVKRQASRGIFQTTWALTGYEVAVDPDGGEGATKVWESDNFTIIYDGPLPK